MPWNFGKKIEAVVVSPYVTQSYFDRIRAIVSKLCPTFRGQIRWSSLYGDPIR